MKETDRSGIASGVGILFTKQDTETILTASQNKLIEIASRQTQLIQYGKKYVGLCPKCKHPFDPCAENVEDYTFVVEKDHFSCWSCGIDGEEPISLLMQLDKSYPEALLYLAVSLQLIHPPRYNELYFY